MPDAGRVRRRPPRRSGRRGPARRARPGRPSARRAPPGAGRASAWRGRAPASATGRRTGCGRRCTGRRRRWTGRSGSCAASPAAPARSSAASASGSDDSSGRSATPTDSTAGRLNRAKSWNAAVQRARQLSCAIDVSGTPSTRIAPDVGWYMPSSSLTSVVLPEPFSPTIATVAPAGSVRVSEESTGRSVPGYVNDRSRTRYPGRQPLRGLARCPRRRRRPRGGPRATAGGRRSPGWRSCRPSRRRPRPAGRGSGGSARPS